MENSSFLPNPLTSPALMVLASTAADSNRENHRLQGSRQFSPQSGDKDLPVPFSSSYPMFRQGDHFPPLYAPMHMPFVQPSVGPIGRSGSGAFRPLPQGDDRDRDYHHSAFVPTKRSKHEDSFELRTSPESKENGDHRLDSPGTKDGPLTPNSITYELSSETFSESGESQDRSTPDAEGRNLRRQRKRTLDGQFPCCPVCGITLRVGEIESHFAAELEKLDKISKNGRRAPSRETTPQGRKFIPSPSCSSGMRRGKDSPGLDGASQSRLETYLRVKSNRQSRLSAKTRGKKKRCQEETVCPVCTEKVFGTPEELNDHVEQCLKRMQQEHEDAEVDVEGNYEEYTWAGQTRIRATTMLEGGFKGSGFTTASKREEDEDVNLDVDGDDADVYGKPQYSEKDIIPCNMDDPTEQKELQALRGAYLKTEMNSSSTSSPSERNRWSMEETCNEGGGHSSQNTESAKEYDNIEGSRTEIIESLRIKIKTQTKAGLKGDKHKCLICMEPYTVPLTSTQCWHVHCEECWLRTLGAKKLCPQCNTITSPADLRRIYF